MEKYRKQPPKYCALHWDGKLLKDTLGQEEGDPSEALAVLVSGSPQYEEGKLLGVPKLYNLTG